MSVEIIKSKIRDVVDFPQKGIVFRDLTTVFKDADCLRELSDMLTAIYAEKGILVNLYDIYAILFGITFLPSFSRKFSRFAHRHESGSDTRR